MQHFPPALLTLALVAFGLGDQFAVAALPGDFDDDQIVIVEGEKRTIYEYRQAGILMMIKIVPKKGRAYYMVPVDGAPHYESLDHKRKLYPQWVIVEW